jgi:FG-GAP-like repeat
MRRRWNKMGIFLLVLLGFVGLTRESHTDGGIAYSDIKPRVIQLDLPIPDEGIGGLVAADVNDDGRKDFIITKKNHITVHDHVGEKLWGKNLDIQVTVRAELFGLPGWQAPGVQAADVDGDGNTEVLYLIKDGALQIVHGATGREKWRVRLPAPEGSERWEHLVVANFRGAGDRDLLLQATNAQGFRRGRYLAAYALNDLTNGVLNPLWERNDYVGSPYSGARVADLDGDGKDEVLGATVVGPDGKVLLRVPVTGDIDSILVADIRPDVPGLEVVALEEGGHGRILPHSNPFFRTANRLYRRFFPDGNRIFLYNNERVIWASHFNHQEPQNAVVGNFDPDRRGLEVWCRGRKKRQKPFVFDSHGQTISDYTMDDVAPKDWTERGVEVIWRIDWTGAPKQLAAAKERHRSGDVAIFDPISGKFLHRFGERADRIYVADVSGDWREELIVLNGNELHIYENNEPNPNPNRPRLWNQNHYRRGKMTWNYYNP